MATQEVHDTLQSIRVNEKLTFELEITETAYTSDQELEGEFEILASPNDDVIRNREAPPRNIVTPYLQDDSDSRSGFPGTNLFLAVTADPIADREEALDGLTGTIPITIGWDLETAEQLLAENQTKIAHSEQYQLDRFTSDDRPFVVRGELYRDAREYMENRDHLLELLDRQNRSPRSLEGQAALSIRLDHKSNISETIEIDEFHVDMAQTFPEIDYLPFEDATYSPENRRIEWHGQDLDPDGVVVYNILGPIDQLLEMGEVSATLSGTIPNTTLGGISVESVFDATGFWFPNQPPVNKQVEVGCSILMDPDALRGETRSTSRSQIEVPLPPEETHEQLVNLCEREALQIRHSNPPSGQEPVAGQDGVFDYTSPGEIEVKREYGDEGTVYADMTVEGQFTAVSQTSEISAFDEDQDRLVREDSGALERRGKSVINIHARSNSSDLNANLINTIEQGFRSGDQPALSGD